MSIRLEYLIIYNELMPYLDSVPVFAEERSPRYSEGLFGWEIVATALGLGQLNARP
jgi:hypothetical protein